MQTKRVPKRSARLIALTWAIRDGIIDPDRSNMSEVARALGVDRATILRDLRDVRQTMDEIGGIYARLRTMPHPSDTSNLRSAKEGGDHD